MDISWLTVIFFITGPTNLVFLFARIIWCTYAYWRSEQVREVYSKIYPTRRNVSQVIYIWKLLYMFRVVPPTIIRSIQNRIYSIWYLSDRKLLPVAIVEEMELSSNSSTIAAGSSNGLINNRCCRCSCMCSWWWVEVPPETSRTFFRNE